MLIVCPSCATSYNVEPANLLPGRRHVRCLHCRTAWLAETPRRTNTGSDNALRNAVPVPSIPAADRTGQLNRTARCERTAGLDAFELIRQQAHAALNAIREGCREDHNRIVNCLGAVGAISPSCADKSLAGAAAIAPQPSLLDAGWDTATRTKLSQAFAEVLAEASNEMAPNCADELPDNEQPAIGQEAGSFALAFDSEQPADGGFIAAVDEVREGGWAASATDELDAAAVVALDGTAASELNDFAEVEVPPIAPVDLEVEERSVAPVDLIEDRLEIEIDADVSTDNCPDGPPEEIQPFAGRRRRGGARRWLPPRWPMSRLQTVILVLLVVDCIVVGWRAEVVRALPQTSSFYKLVGLLVNLQGLTFDGVATTTEQHEGMPVLVVEGNIINVTRKVADVPRLKFIVRKATGQEIYSWTAVPSRPLLPPGEAVSFRTQLASPSPDAHDVLLRFVDHSDIVATVD